MKEKNADYRFVKGEGVDSNGKIKHEKRNPKQGAEIRTEKLHHPLQEKKPGLLSPKLVASAIILVHLLIPLVFLSVDKKEPADPTGIFLRGLEISRSEFLNQFFITGIFFYLILATVYLTGFVKANLLKGVGIVVCLSGALSFLLAYDKALVKSYELPDGLWNTFYVLITERQALLSAVILSLIITTAGVYFFIKSFFKVTYSGLGIQINLPGQSVYYFPVYPQMPWQNTGICLEKDDKMIIEISGYVSPGALKDIKLFEDHMTKFVQSQKGTLGNEELKPPPTWPYTTAAGYSKSWYRPENRPDVLKQHPLYCENDYYKKDNLLTVKGLPHNVVIGYIHAAGEEEPKQAALHNPAYDWEKDKDKLLYLSSEKYPITLTANKPGMLWVVINDVDIARWDNGGLFFIKISIK